MANVFSSLKPTTPLLNSFRQPAQPQGNPALGGAFSNTGLLGKVMNKAADIGQGISNFASSLPRLNNFKGEPNYSPYPKTNTTPNVPPVNQPPVQTKGTNQINLPSVEDTNRSFMAQNPQFSQPGDSLLPKTDSSNNGYVDASGSYIPPTSQSDRNTAQGGTVASTGKGGTFSAGTVGLLNQVFDPTTGKMVNRVAQPQVNTLQNIAENQTPAVTEAQKQYAQFAKESPLLLSDVRNNPNVAAEVSVGRGQALGQTLSAEQQALASNVQNALAGQGQQITAANEAGGLNVAGQGQQISAAQQAASLTQPQAGAAFFGSPESGNVVGSGQGGTGNTLIDTSLNLALNTIARGGSTNDAMASLVGGDVAKTAFIKKMQEFDPNWTPTSSNAIAAQNMQQGQQYQGLAFNLDTALKQFKSASQPILSLIQGTGLNQQSNPFFNKSINDYVKYVNNPAATAGLTAGVNELKNYVSSILGASGELTPTEVTNMTESVDFGNFSYPDLVSFLGMIDNYGQIRLGQLQEQAGTAFGTQTNLKTGTQATPSAQSIIPKGYQNNIVGNNQLAQGLLGGAINSAGTVGTAIGIVKHFFGQ